MARNINKRLDQLKARRQGTDRLDRLALDEQRVVLAKSLQSENWQMREKSRPYTRYALGSMQEVGPDYTRISIETAQRVQQQLASGLSARGFSVGFRLQGSVPLNVHIRGVSDVDLLNIDTNFLTYMAIGQHAREGRYTGTTLNSIDVLLKLRAASEQILKDKYPAAVVDVSGGKAISISGGSLQRPVDVVPAPWHDTIEYQASNAEHDRGVQILNKKVPETVQNLPFLHIKRIDERDQQALGGLKKSIRLCKNVKSDAESDGTDITLPSFDIAAMMYHANMQSLRNGVVYELAILAETQRHVDALARNLDAARKLMVPDGTRAIFNTDSKLQGLIKLSLELDDLSLEVAKELNANISLHNSSLNDSRTILSSTFIPT